MSHFFHSFHMVSMSPWPIISGLISIMMTTSTVMLFKFYSFNMLFLSVTLFIIISFIWWKDVSREGVYGDHTTTVQDGLKWGMALFILSEVLFFAAWFWAFFHNSLVPVQDLGMVWPPFSVVAMNPFSVPLLNTVILLSSGVSVTMAHHNLINNASIKQSMICTIVLGVMFTMCQLMEYMEADFSISESTFGGSFFVTTGFHGLHVIIGSLFLITIFVRSLNMELSPSHHLGAEFAIWYWHFVDIVWLFLFSFMYWWTV